MMEDRPDPDRLLEQVQAEEKSARRGRLKIFLGYAAGVGKTYAMLEAARQRKAEGTEVVVGYLETHKRLETDRLAQGLETIPRKSIEYHGVLLTEMDVDAVLARHPKLALVDELAHTNAPGSRHPKRYLDVEELLEAGIDVYTTLNIQHLESLNDVVAQITGVLVRETIPDGVIDEANELELIDLPPEELLTRLREGKVYVPDQAARAIQDFFRKGNLTALREMTMRRAAERVDDQMRSYMETQSIAGPWAAAERLLVCISPNPLGERLVRSARRLADELNAEWLAVYVQTPHDSTLPQQKRDLATSSLRLAEELGARIVVLPASGPARTLAYAVINFAHKNNVTKIVAGKPMRPRWMEFLRGSFVDELIHQSGNIDIYVVPSSEPARMPPEENPFHPRSPLLSYLSSLVLVTGATGLGYLIGNSISPTNLVMVYLLAVVVSAVYLGRGPSILASLASVLAFDFFFVPPRYTFSVSETEYLLTFIGLLLVGTVISYLTVQVREQANAAQAREVQTTALYELGRDLTATVGVEVIAQTVITHISQTFNRDAAIFLPEKDGPLKVWASSPNLAIADNELAVADWTFEHRQVAGRGSNTLPDASMRYQPLQTTRGIVGVLGIKPANTTHFLTPDQRRTLDAFANQAAIAIERARLVDQARQTEILEITDKLQSALLNSISHDLRTPLVSITGALSSLSEDSINLNDATRRSLIETARGEADRLNRLVGNLLEMTRLEAGAVRVQAEPCDIQDMIGSALEQVESRKEDHPIIVNIPSDLPFVSMDFVLISHVLVNVIDNALKYSAPGSPIEIGAHLTSGYMEIEVADRGIGIPREDLSRIFDKFYRVQRPDNITGTGLGLSISKGIVEAHGGFIAAENRPGGGTMITVALPVR
ncbi:MAG TPA: sensor histidine kinase KdpD [Anaerolineales bacterium]|nr:sensor histidine kinase KdpD [Anaerolineales bacterium]